MKRKHILSVRALLSGSNTLLSAEIMSHSLLCPGFAFQSKFEVQPKKGSKVSGSNISTFTFTSTIFSFGRRQEY